MWTTDQPLNATAVSRPARLAYLIPLTPSHELLDILISESLSRWGGRRTPFIPTDGKTIESVNWDFLDLWDADIIYSYVELSKELENRLYYCFAPSEIRNHTLPIQIDNVSSLRPDYTGNFNFISSLSLLPYFERRAEREGSEPPVVADKEYFDEDDRDLADSFGFVSRSCVNVSLQPHGRVLSLRRDEYVRQFNDSEASYLQNIDELTEAIATRSPRVLTLSRLADMLCPYLNAFSDYQNGWNDHLSIVVGDSPNDRLLFWNTAHRYSALNNNEDLPVLRISPKRFESGIPAWFNHWIAIRNQRQSDGVYAKRTIFRSCSLSEEELNKIVHNLNAKARNLILSIEHHESSSLFEPCKKITSEQSAAWIFPNVPNRTTIRFRGKELDFPSSPPWHVETFKSSVLSHGVWALDMMIESIENHSPYSNQHHLWKFPRRLRIETAIQFEGYASSISHRGIPIVPPPIRPTRIGNLTIWDSADWSRPTLMLPSDYGAICNALQRFAPGCPELRKRAREHAEQQNASLDCYLPESDKQNDIDYQPFSNLRFDRVTVSDKGRDLLGILQFFGSLPEALYFLDNPFWRNVISKLSPEEPQDKKKYIEDIAARMKTSVSNAESEPPDYSRIAKRVLALAARSFTSQKLGAVNFQKLLTWAEEQYKQSQDYRKNQLKEDLVTSATYLRNREFLWQGFHWKCEVCEHHNWKSMDRLTTISFCEICRMKKSSPVAESLHLRLNPFVQHAFSSTSSQGPVIWCLKQLANRVETLPGNHSRSFSFAPALDLYRNGDKQPWTDIDVTASINGLVYIVEVKQSFAGVTETTFEQLNQLAVELKPDVLMLAVQESMTDNEKIREMRDELSKELRQHDVLFELLTLDSVLLSSIIGDDRIPRQLDNQMNWSAW